VCFYITFVDRPRVACRDRCSWRERRARETRLEDCGGENLSASWITGRVLEGPALFRSGDVVEEPQQEAYMSMALRCISSSSRRVWRRLSRSCSRPALRRTPAENASTGLVGAVKYDVDVFVPRPQGSRSRRLRTVRRCRCLGRAASREHCGAASAIADPAGSAQWGSRPPSRAPPRGSRAVQPPDVCS